MPPQGMSTSSLTIINLPANPTQVASCDFDAYSAYSHPRLQTVLCCADILGLPGLWDKQLIALQLPVICT